MVKPFHHDLKRKMNVIGKPKLIDSEFIKMSLMQEPTLQKMLKLYN